MRVAWGSFDSMSRSCQQSRYFLEGLFFTGFASVIGMT